MFEVLSAPLVSGRAEVSYTPPKKLEKMVNQDLPWYGIPPVMGNLFCTEHRDLQIWTGSKTCLLFSCSKCQEEVI